MDLLLHLRGFVAVADNLSVSRAADQLGIDQPLLSRRIRSLEGHLGVSLLDRTRRQIKITDAGIRLVPRARALLDQADQLVGGVADQRRDVFRLGLPVSVDPAGLARLVELLADHDIEVALERSGQSAEQFDRSGPGWWIERTTADAADWVAELGVACRASDQRFGPMPGGRLRLGDLRPRRGRSGTRIMITDEDDGPWLLEPLREIADRSGLSPRLIRSAPAVIARAEVIAGRAVLICSDRFADHDGLDWTALDDPGIRRWYRLIESDAAAASLAGASGLRSRVLYLIGALLDAEPADADHAERWEQR